jgi:peptidoglycan/LPS O-acetylase OafA/YrhL
LALQIAQRFRRLTSGGAFVPELDGLRFVAIASVIAHHLFGQLQRYYGIQVSPIFATIMNNGNRGVPLFFGISGFILAKPFAAYWMKSGQKVDLKRYFLRRLTRLEPPYILNLLACFALLLIVNHVALRELLPHLAASLCYSHNLAYGTLSEINPVAWSLEIEVQFYILVPLLTLVFAIGNAMQRRAVIVFAMLALSLAHLHWPSGPRFNLSILSYIQFFLTGFLLADLYLTNKSDSKRWLWDLVSLVGWPAVFLLDGKAQLLLPFLILALYWAAFHGPISNRVFCYPLVTVIGGMCYSIYLFHFQVIALATRLLGHHANPILMTISSLVMILLGCSLYFLLLERPCMDKDWPAKLRQRLSRRRAVPSPMLAPQASGATPEELDAGSPAIPIHQSPGSETGNV